MKKEQRCQENDFPRTFSTSNNVEVITLADEDNININTNYDDDLNETISNNDDNNNHNNNNNFDDNSDETFPMIDNSKSLCCYSSNFVMNAIYSHIDNNNNESNVIPDNIDNNDHNNCGNASNHDIDINTNDDNNYNHDDNNYNHDINMDDAYPDIDSDNDNDSDFALDNNDNNDDFKDDINDKIIDMRRSIWWKTPTNFIVELAEYIIQKVPFGILIQNSNGLRHFNNVQNKFDTI